LAWASAGRTPGTARARKASRAAVLGAPPRDVLAAEVPYRRHRYRLRSGLTLVVIETPHLHSAQVALYARVGSRYETSRTSGLSHFVEHMLFRGCKSLPSSFALNDAIESIGGTLYAETGRDYSLYQIPLHPREVARGLAILGDLFATPRFVDIDLERQIILEELLEDHDDRGRNINIDDVSRAAVWDDHPLGFPIAGPMANVRRFSTADVRRHFRRYYGARNMVLCVTGPVDPAAVVAQAQRAFARLPAGKRAEPRPAPAPRGKAQLVIVPNDAAQTQVQIVFHGLADADPDYMALSAMMRLLDDGMSTRLHYQICDQKGLAYQVSGALEPLHDTALVDVDAACAHGKLYELVEQGLGLLRQFRDEPVSEKDLEKAKRRYRGDIEASFDDLDSLGGWYGGTELFYRPRTHAARIAEFEALTAADVQRVARRVIVPERLTVAAVGEVKAATAKRLRRLITSFLR